MIKHIHSRTLEAFKEKRRGGEEFAVAACDSKKSSIVQFDKECSGIVPNLANGHAFLVQQKNAAVMEHSRRA